MHQTKLLTIFRHVLIPEDRKSWTVDCQVRVLFIFKEGKKFPYKILHPAVNLPKMIQR
jgi:hypothetical protein